jgi:hypothetical protein
MGKRAASIIRIGYVDMGAPATPLSFSPHCVSEREEKLGWLCWKSD